MKDENQTEKEKLSHDEVQLLLEELEHYRNEKEAVKQIIGQIGGKNRKKNDKRINLFFVVLIVILFIFDILRSSLHFDFPLPEMFSLQISIFLVSLKIILMMHKQSKLEHFHFWILNSIEYKLNQISIRLMKLKNKK